MGNYNSQYENYYNSLSSRINNRGNIYGQKQKNYFNKDKFFRIIRIQLLGTLLLFTIIFTCKVYVTPQTKAVYNFAKYTINENYDIKSLISYGSNINLSNVSKYVKKENFNDMENKIVNLIDNERAKFTGSKTIKQEINQEFAVPVAGSLTKTELDNGLQFKVPINTDIKAVYSGIVESAGENKEDGKYIVIDHGSGIETKYSNLNLIDVKMGEKVNKNDVIGKSGNSSKDKTGGLYFQLIYMGENLNPTEYLKN
ncbi:Peptidase family M23 [Clostridium acidisoli DSM 12555]|uniref:Peptidase family M23 n=1 Tax=Clostridium acidisoli DSM 12555 TaxID=1121291 RepID=A0A1W1X5H7_9CLOT|nr:M23 family metallopeptidase [Clostridium acidisoli]SMC19107.1 Peptidase family M23 [Clostridium acidisoli DSM 12555]